MKRSDITVRYYDHESRPVVNVKVTRAPTEKDFAMLVERDPRFTLAWIEANVSDDDRNHAWDEACRHCFEQAEEDAKEIFGQSTKLYQAGRSGGWLYIDGMTRESMEHWNAIDVAKWAKFEKWSKQTADDVPFQYLWYINERHFGEWASQQTTIESFCVEL